MNQSVERKAAKPKQQPAQLIAKQAQALLNSLSELPPKDAQAVQRRLNGKTGYVLNEAEDILKTLASL